MTTKDYVRGAGRYSPTERTVCGDCRSWNWQLGRGMSFLWGEEKLGLCVAERSDHCGHIIVESHLPCQEWSKELEDAPDLDAVEQAWEALRKWNRRDQSGEQYTVRGGR